MSFFRERTFRVPTARGSTLTPVAAIAIALLGLGLSAQAVSAARSGGDTKLTRSTPAKARYAIEFRSRYALSYGHTFIMYGRLNAKGQLIDRVVAGLHPAGDSPQPWMIGHLVPVPSETGPSDGDLEDEYVSARYRVEVSEAEYQRVVAYIKDKQAKSPTWHAVFNNCSSWVADVGRYMGLKSPNPMLMPADFINTMRKMNEGNDRSSALSLAAAQ